MRVFLFLNQAVTLPCLLAYVSLWDVRKFVILFFTCARLKVSAHQFIELMWPMPTSKYKTSVHFFFFTSWKDSNELTFCVLGLRHIIWGVY